MVLCVCSFYTGLHPVLLVSLLWSFRFRSDTQILKMSLQSILFALLFLHTLRHIITISPEGVKSTAQGETLRLNDKTTLTTSPERAKSFTNVSIYMVLRHDRKK